MDLTDKLIVGQVVKSRAGRDARRAFLIYEIIDERFVTVVDGDLRKLDSPKKKNVKHLIIFNEAFSDFKDNVEKESEFNDAYIRRILEPFNDRSI